MQLDNHFTENQLTQLAGSRQELVLNRVHDGYPGYLYGLILEKACCGEISGELLFDLFADSRRQTDS